MSETKDKLKHVLGRVAAVTLGVTTGFFVAFNVVFADVFGFAGMAWAVVFVFVAYWLMGVAFGMFGTKTGVNWVWWLAPAGVIYVALGLLDNVAQVAYHAAVIAAVVGGVATGALFGVRVAEWARAKLRRGEVEPTP